ncbi:MAG: hypothetical protein AAGJ83_04660 [Planctomycetota bacterium]
MFTTIGEAFTMGFGKLDSFFYRDPCMALWIDRFVLVALIVVIVVLTVTSVSAFGGEPLAGDQLLGHMMASGVLVVGLPVFAIAFLRHFPKPESSWTLRVGVMLTIATGLGSMATVFLCMLPIPSTDEMHLLIGVHRWVGLGMIPAAGLVIVGVSLKRSASRPRS